ncbi:MAG: hypothetical protein MJE63_30340, partial [Proteobacteria bacterium]|nr:hypothetical protein [Pseudomonadota bacterium]
EGKKVLDNEDDIKRIFFDSLPSIISKRIESITPPNFNISEIEFKMNLGGKLFGVEVGGNMLVKFSPNK